MRVPLAPRNYVRQNLRPMTCDMTTESLRQLFLHQNCLFCHNTLTTIHDLLEVKVITWMGDIKKLLGGFLTKFIS